jgi:GTP-binding protein Era
VIDLVKKSGGVAFLLLNKIDKLPKDKLLPMIEHYSKLHEFREIIPISASKRDGLDTLIDKIIRALPDGPRYFPEDQLTDQPERFIASEIIREKVLLKTGKEIPYATAVLIDRYEEQEKLTRIAATIYCEREGQKAILIGKGGQKIKEIGTAARIELENRRNHLLRARRTKGYSHRQGRPKNQRDRNRRAARAGSAAGKESFPGTVR